MSLNKIEIPELLISELYGDSLLIAGRDAHSPVPATTPSRVNSPSPQNAPSATAAASARTTPPAATPAQAAAPETGPAYKFLGNNRRKITILVNSPGNAFLPDDQLNVLTKMLEACRMNIGDVAIVNHANTPVNIAGLRQQLAPSVALLFGLQPADIKLPIQFPIFKIQAYADCTFLCAPGLGELVPPTEESKLLKSKLWVCLKSIFEL